MKQTKGRLVPLTPDALDKTTTCKAPDKATAVQVRRLHRASHTATCLYIPQRWTRVNRSARRGALEPRAATGTLPLDFHNSSGDEDPSAAIPGRNYSRVPLELALDATLGGWNSHARATTRQALNDYLRRRRGARKEPKQ